MTNAYNSQRSTPKKEFATKPSIAAPVQSQPSIQSGQVSKMSKIAPTKLKKTLYKVHNFYEGVDMSPKSYSPDEELMDTTLQVGHMALQNSAY